MDSDQDMECLPHFYDDYNPQRSNLFFGCLSAANGLKNAFVLVQISRFQQIIGVCTLQAPNENAKVLNLYILCHLRHTVSMFQFAVMKSSIRSMKVIVYNSL